MQKIKLTVASLILFLGPWLHSQPTYSVTYTGRLFGYFRYPEVQLVDSTSQCPTANPTAASAPEAARFRDDLADAGPTGVLVATGDNFAPFLLARRAWLPNNPGIGGWLQPKEDYLDRLPVDNVGCFLRLAHFDAVVPGKHDFYFGPQHLQKLAEYLNRPEVGCGGGTACYKSVKMLGGNLSLKSQRTSPAEQTGAGQGAGAHGAGREGEPEVVIPKGVVLPWMTAIRVKNPPAPGQRLFLCEYDATDIDPESPDPCDAPDRILLDIHPPTGIPVLPQSFYERTGGYYWLPRPVFPRITVLQPGLVYRIFQENVDKALARFKVAQPFFYRSEDDKRRAWKIVHSNGQTIAIFGVVDPDLDQFVGRLNYTWLGQREDPHGENDCINADNSPEPQHCVRDKSYETVVDASDPAEALNQILQSCYYDAECRSAHKVLLAQMSQGKLQENVLPLLHLPADTQKFDIAITEVDANSATGERTTTLTTFADPSPTPERDPFQRPTVLVPGSHYGVQNGFDLRIRLQRADITESVGSHSVINHVFVDPAQDPLRSNPFNHYAAPLDTLRESETPNTVLRDRIRAALHDQTFTPVTADQWLTGLEHLALDLMRDACHADIAMIQHRDLFVDNSVVPLIRDTDFKESGIDAAIGALFWKGDFIQCLNVTGQTLSSVLQHSRDLQQIEDQGQYTELSQGWPLTYTGISAARTISGVAKAQWLVHGEFLDPKRLYSVAVTDYLGNGDTGYPDLQNAEPDPQVNLADVRMRRFADHVLWRLIQRMPANREKIYAMRDELPDLNNKGNVPASAQTNAMTDWLRSWAAVSAFPARFPTDNGFDFKEQQMPTTYLRLYKLDFNYSLFQHNVNEAALGSQFPGVTAVDLSNPDSENFGIDWQLRWQRDWKDWAYYAETDANFARRNQRSKNGPYQPSQSANAWYLETGPAWRLYPKYQNPSGFKFIFPMSVKSQLVPPYTQITPIQAKGGSGGSANPISAPINYYLAFRPGFRFEHNFPRPQSNSPGGAGGSGSSGGAGSGGSGGGSSTGGGSKGKGGGGQQGAGQGQSQSATLSSYFEGGFQAGEVFHSPSAFQFDNPGTSVSPCSTGLVPIGNLVQCVNVLGPNATLKHVFGDRNFYQQGVYLNARLDIPLPGRSTGEYIMENRGDFFFKRSSDTPVDVRLLDDWKHSLQFPIFSKVTIGPSVEFVFFKTKVTGNYYFSYSTSVSLNYSFDWHPGLSWPKVLGFGSSLPAPNPLPTK